MMYEVEPVEMRTYIPPVLHQKIRAAADESVRSMSAEIAYRLRKSFEQDETRATSQAFARSPSGDRA